MPARITPSAGNRAGFTLIEVLVAVVVLSLGIMATSKLAFRIQEAIYENRQETVAAALGAAKLAELDEYGPTEIEKEGEFEEEYAGFTWRITTQETAVASVTRAKLAIAWADGDEELVFERLFYLP
jgi:prepilin-type N-terminal cleavage/methylation domain-containing protein